MVGVARRRHYDRLHLHTSKGTSGLPYLRFGPEVARYPSRQQMVDYLGRYVAELDLAPRWGEEVLGIRIPREIFGTPVLRIGSLLNLFPDAADIRTSSGPIRAG